jgi:hypothetical protein
MSDNYDPGGWAQYYKEKYAATLERERVLLDHISKIAGALMIGIEDGEYYIPAEPEPIICGASIVDACKAFKEFSDKMALQDGHRVAALEAENAALKAKVARLGSPIATLDEIGFGERIGVKRFVEIIARRAGGE